MATDASYDSVSLLLHGDGTNGATTFTDSSPTPKTATGYGSAQISTTQSKFGGASISFNGTNSYLKIPDHANFLFGSGDWTIEFWFYETATKAAATFLAQMSTDMGVDLDAFYIQSVDGKLKVWMQTDTSLYGKQSTVTHSLNAWHHCAVVRTATLCTVYLDGAFWMSFAVAGAVVDSASDVSVGVLLGNGGGPLNSNVYFTGYLDDIRVTKGVARYTAAFTAPTEAFPNEGVLPNLVYCRSPLPGVAVLALHDFGVALLGSVTNYVMDLQTPSGAVRVPISSWQATLRTGGSNYVQCVVPACADWVSTIQTATEFVIYRQAALPSGVVIDYEMARSPLEQFSLDQGPSRYTATLSGYATGFADSAEPPLDVYDRTLSSVRSISHGTSSMRVRCAVDLLLRPGHRAYVDEQPISVAYINYYCTSNGDSFMDVGSAA